MPCQVLKGVCKGQAGSFPGHFVENTEDGQRCGDPSQHFKMGVKCRALGNYTAKTPQELSFQRGDVIFIAVLNNNKMLQGVCQGKAGLVPRSYVVDVAEEGNQPSASIAAAAAASATADAPKVAVARCCAIRSHFSNREGWLDFDVGDIVMVPKKAAGKVWQGVFKGNVGKLRADFVVDTAEVSPDVLEEMMTQARDARDVKKQLNAPAAVAAAPASMPFAATPSPAKVKTTVGDPFAVGGAAVVAVPVNDPFAPVNLPLGPSAVDPFAPQSQDPFAVPTPGRRAPATASASAAVTATSRRPGRPGASATGAGGALLPTIDASIFEGVEAAPASKVVPLPVTSPLASKHAPSNAAAAPAFQPVPFDAAAFASAAVVEPLPAGLDPDDPYSGLSDEEVRAGAVEQGKRVEEGAAADRHGCRRPVRSTRAQTLPT